MNKGPNPMDSLRVRLRGLVALLLATGCGLGGGSYTPVQTAFNRGVYHHTAGRFAAAVEEYRRAAEEDPEDLRARFNLALALEEQAAQSNADLEAQLRAAALAQYDEILRQRPEHLRAGLNRAVVDWEEGRSQAALDRLRRIMDAHPDVSLPVWTRAAYLLEQEDWQAAEDVLREGLDRAPESPSGQTLLGQCLVHQGRLGEAQEAFEAALETEGADLAALLALGDLQLRREQPQAAEVSLTRALLIDPDLWQAHWLMVQAAQQRDDLEAATLHLWQARDLDYRRPERVALPDYQTQLSDLYQQLAN